MNLSGISRVITQALGLYDALNKPFSINPTHNNFNGQTPYNNINTQAPYNNNTNGQPPVNNGREDIKQFYVKKIKDFLNQKI